MVCWELMWPTTSLLGHMSRSLELTHLFLRDFDGLFGASVFFGSALQSSAVLFSVLECSVRVRV